MRPSEAKRTIRLAIEARQPVFLWGGPGTAKSSLVQQVTYEKQGRQLIDVRAGVMDGVDWHGIPMTVQNKDGSYSVNWAAPSFMPTDPKSEGVIFLDELNSAVPIVQAGAYQLVRDRRCGERNLPGGWTVIGAGNRDVHRSVTFRMPSALNNRFVHIEVSPDLEESIAWGIDNGWCPEVLAFLRYRPELLYKFDGDAIAFPSPRSWEFLSGMMAKKPDPSIEGAIYQGTVGDGAAGELQAFLAVYRDLPDIDEIKRNPTTVSIPQKPNGLYAVASALGHHINGQCATPLFRYLGRLPEEFQVFSVKDMLRKRPEIVDTEAYSKWAAKHTDLFSVQ